MIRNISWNVHNAATSSLIVLRCTLTSLSCSSSPALKPAAGPGLTDPFLCRPAATALCTTLAPDAQDRLSFQPSGWHMHGLYCAPAPLPRNIERKSAFDFAGGPFPGVFAALTERGTNAMAGAPPPGSRR